MLSREPKRFDLLSIQTSLNFIYTKKKKFLNHTRAFIVSTKNHDTNSPVCHLSGSCNLNVYFNLIYLVLYYTRFGLKSIIFMNFELRIFSMSDCKM